MTPRSGESVVIIPTLSYDHIQLKNTEDEKEKKMLMFY